MSILTATDCNKISGNENFIAERKFRDQNSRFAKFFSDSAKKDFLLFNLSLSLCLKLMRFLPLSNTIIIFNTLKSCFEFRI